MMQQAFVDIGNSDLLIAKVSEKAIGAGIEIGYAIAAKHVVFYKTGENLTKKTSPLYPALPDESLY